MRRAGKLGYGSLGYKRLNDLSAHTPAHSGFLSLEGLLSQKTEHDLTVPASVTVQHGLCVHIPCSFTSGKIGSEKLYGYWFVKIDGYWEYFVTSFGVQTIHGTVVATNDKRIALPSFVRNRFNFTGNVNEGNCSLSILNAKSQDTGQYYFRIESSKVLFSYNTKPHMLLKVVVTGYRTLHWSQQNSDGSWTHGSDFIFTPSAGDRGKQLTCWVWYPNIDKRVQNTILLDFADSSHSDKSVVNKTWRGTSGEMWCFTFFWKLLPAPEAMIPQLISLGELSRG
ncbi:UNVERIFIED_CONTAM: hypothetical protein K2H54_024418 [Gekko kuhli]